MRSPTRLLAIALCGCLLSGCEQPRPDPAPYEIPSIQDPPEETLPVTSAGQQKKAADLLSLCYFIQAEAADDHISDAQTIAKAITAACHEEAVAWVIATEGGMPKHYLSRLTEHLDTDMEPVALPFVLKERRKPRGKHPNQ